MEIAGKSPYSAETGSRAEAGSMQISGNDVLRARFAPERIEALQRAHEHVAKSVRAGTPPAGKRDLVAALSGHSAIRPFILHSWVRSAADAIDPTVVPGHFALTPDELERVWHDDDLHAALPVVQRLLLDAARDAGHIVAVGDAAGRLLWVDGHHATRSLAEDIGFTSGTDWSERAVGISAPGAAVTLNRAVQVFGPEHYNRFVHDWSCTAAPIRHPIHGHVIGVVDVTGNDDAAAAHVVPLLQAVVAAAEAEIRLSLMRTELESLAPTPPVRRVADDRDTRTPAEPSIELRVLGQDPALLIVDGATLTLRARHAEILICLALEPTGLSMEALAEAVYGTREAQQNLRAEMVRLRKWIKDHGLPIRIGSRPYRLETLINIDALHLLRDLTEGRHEHAIARYRGAVLRASEAEPIVALRNDVDASLRETLLESAEADLLFAYAERWAWDDEQVWQTLLTVLSPSSPKRGRVVSRLAALEERARQPSGNLPSRTV